jgi:hypothetical protein
MKSKSQTLRDKRDSETGDVMRIILSAQVIELSEQNAKYRVLCESNRKAISVLNSTVLVLAVCLAASLSYVAYLSI